MFIRKEHAIAEDDCILVFSGPGWNMKAWRHIDVTARRAADDTDSL